MAARTYIAYLDEFGHVGPYVDRQHPKHRTSPVFGLAGYVLPAERVRWFATWFFKRKCELLEFEIRRSKKQAALWEKKGSSLYTVQNVEKYRELRHFTYRMLRQLHRLGGFVFHVGMEKDAAPSQHNPKGLYAAVFGEAIKRLDDFCEASGSASFLLALDQHEAMRPILITHAARAMFGGESPKRRLIEPPISPRERPLSDDPSGRLDRCVGGALGGFSGGARVLSRERELRAVLWTVPP